GQERGFHRARRQSARRHRQRPKDCEGLSAGPGSGSCGGESQVAGSMEQGYPDSLESSMKVERCLSVVAALLVVFASSTGAQDLGPHFRKIKEGIYVQSAREVN